VQCLGTSVVEAGDIIFVCCEINQRSDDEIDHNHRWNHKLAEGLSDKLKLNQERIGVVLGNFLEVVLVAFWAIFSGPEPLTCWILINPSEYSGFQGGRAALFVGIGLPLFVFISFCHHFGGNLQTVP